MEIPVFLADSLVTPQAVSQLSMLLGDFAASGSALPLRFADRVREVPSAVFDDPAYYDPLVTAADELAERMASPGGGAETLAGFKRYLERRLPGLVRAGHMEFDGIAESMYRVAEDFASLRRAGRDSIWAFVLRNLYRPTLLKGRFDVVVGNPPWLAFREVKHVRYQEEIRGLADRYGLAATGKLRTHLDLAEVFLVHAAKHFLREGGRIAFVMPRGVMNADQYDAIRRGKCTASFLLREVWDLAEVRPLFNVPTCVAFGERAESAGATVFPLPGRVFEGRLPDRNASLSEAGPVLTERPAAWQLRLLADRSTLAEGETGTSAERASAYFADFRQGATLVPRNFWFVRPAAEPTEPDAEVFVETDEVQRREAKAPWKDHVLSGKVEGRFLYRAVLSKNLVPFALVDPPWAVLPIEPDAGENAYRMLSADVLRRRGWPWMAGWLERAEGLWETVRGDKADRMTMPQRLDYQHGLSEQRPGARHLVLYNAAGTNVTAVHVAVADGGQPPVLEHKVYWAEFQTGQEADYLAGVLNSTVINAAIKPFQSRGLMGERDIEKKVLLLPIPRFRPGFDLHERLAALSASAREKACRAAAGLGAGGRLAADRGAVREAVAGEIAVIDAIVRGLLNLRS